ncbi:uncharacterized protein PAC_04153 [Phialocephala subalpina]|uniref:Uncharacterized protein n=1 Tax=Phialocephala subalpina TaxID=576137 RepID=A0A1L7WNB8_9HELO|nr:uncharacterized protein PAC_04153 [Phialocephala subalpina]
MAEWLRPFPGFGRARTPMPTGNDRPATSSFDEGTESEEGSIPRLRPASRVSSYIGLRPNTSPVYDTDTFPNFRKPDNVYYRPSGDQMAEMLKVAVMSKGTFDPLPKEYNSCILHVLEAYQGMRDEIAKKDEEIEAMKQRHTMATKDFENMATKWEAREKDYQAELKKLEVILSKTEGGMEKIMLARTKSRVHGSKKIKEAVNELRSANQRDTGRALKDDQAVPTGTEDNQEPLYIQPGGRLTSRRKKKNNRKISDVPPPEASPANDPVEAPPRNRLLNRASRGNLLNLFAGKASDPGPSSKKSPRLIEAQLKAVEREKSIREHGVAFDSDSSDSSSEEEAGLELRIRGHVFELESSLQKPLPVTPRTIPRKLRRGVSDQTDSPKTTLGGLSMVPNQMGFSFRPGDDTSILGKRSSESSRRVSEDSIMRRSSDQTTQMAAYREGTGILPGRRSSIPRPLPKVTKFPSPEPQSQYGTPLHRYNSKSSVLTAFRADSGRSSSDDSKRNSLIGQRKMATDKRSGNSDAITAAARAVARSSTVVRSDEKNSSLESPSASGSQQKTSSRTNSLSVETRGNKSGKSSLGSGRGPSNADGAGGNRHSGLDVEPRKKHGRSSLGSCDDGNSSGDDYRDDDFM